MASKEQRIFGLDCMRCAAILCVLLAHLVPSTLKTDPRFGIVFERGAIIAGIVGVELFFTLSGFLIGGILFRDFAAGSFRNGGDLLHFWSRRWLRTLPAYFVVLGLYFICMPPAAGTTSPTGKEPAWWMYALFSQNLLTPIPDYFEVSWSLSVEEWSYIVIPVVLLFFGRWCGRAAMLVTVGGVVLLSPIWRSFNENSLDWLLWIRSTVIYRLDALGFGLMAACLQITRPHLWRKLSSLWCIGALVFVGVIVVLWNGWPLNQSSKLLRILILPVMSCACALWLPALSIWKNSPRNFVTRSVVHISLVSYSIYLLHIPIIVWTRYLCHEVIGFPLDRPFQVMRMIFACIGIIAGASFCYWFVELPAMRLRTPVQNWLRRRNSGIKSQT